MKKQGRHILRKGWRTFVYVSNHPKEERMIELTDDYRLPDGTWLMPELLAWDGVETAPDLDISGVGDD